MSSNHVPLHPSIRRRLSSIDTPLQVSQLNDLVALNVTIRRFFQQQPTFQGFVQDALEQAFPALGSHSDPQAIFIREGNTNPLFDRDHTHNLPAHVLDAVVRRIVHQQPSDYAKGKTVFERRTGTGDATTPVTELTPATFDRFLDALAGELPVRYERYLQHYWSSPIGLTDTRTRKAWLIAQRSEQLRLEAELLKSDGTLSDGAYVLLTKILRYPDNASRQQHLKGYRPSVFSVALKGEGAAPNLLLHGALVLTARAPGGQSASSAPDRELASDASVGTVVLFTPERGLEGFETLAQLDQELHRRLSAETTFEELLMMIAQKHHIRGMGTHKQANAQNQWLYREITDSACAASVEAQCERLREDFVTQIEHFRGRELFDGISDLPDSLNRVTDLGDTFGLQSIELAREPKRIAGRLKAFLKSASPAEQTAWTSAFTQYQHELARVLEWDGLPSLQQFGDKATLLAYANEQLRNALKAEHGLEVDPDHIKVQTRTPRLPSAVYGAGARPVIPDEGPRHLTHTRSLTHVALENVGGLDFNFVNFSTITDNQGKPYEGLSASQVKDLVRGLNIGEKYDAFLKDRLLTSPAALAQRDSYATLMQYQVRLDAVEAKIAGDFLPNRHDRGFNWVNCALDHPEDTSERALVEGHRILVRSLKLRGARVRGVWVFSTASESVGSLVVYMPQAPLGRVFYEFSDRAAFYREVINHSAWHDYLVSRVSRDEQSSVRNLLKTPVPGTLVHLARIADNIFLEAYEIEASAAINSAAAQSTTTQETNIDTVSGVTEVALDVVMAILPIKVTMVIGLARSLYSLVKAIEAAKQGDREVAAHGFVRAFAELVGTVFDGWMGHAPSRKPSQPWGLNSKMAQRTVPSRLTPLKGWERQNVFTQAPVNGGLARHFLKDAGHWYLVKYDADVHVWRVIDARTPFAFHHAPIRRHALGHWEIAAPAIGLKGGFPVERTLMNAFPYLSRTRARQVLDSFSFPQGRVLELELEFAREISTWREIPSRFQAYLNRPVDDVWDLLNGYQPLGASTVTVSEPAVVVPGPGFPIVPSVLPGKYVWSGWRLELDASQLTPNASRPHTFKVPQASGVAAADVIQVEQQFYPILPKGDSFPDNWVHIYDPRLPPSVTADIDVMVSRNIFQQPRLACFDVSSNQWLIDSSRHFKRTPAGYAMEAFPVLTTRAAKKLVGALSDYCNPGGVVSSSGLTAFLAQLNRWRAKGMGLGLDPLMLLQPLSIIDNQALSGFVTLNFNLPKTYGNNLLDPWGAVQAKALLKGHLGAMGYQFIADGGPSPELLFRWPQGDTVYCMIPRGGVSSARHFVPGAPSQLSLNVLDEVSKTLIRQSQDSGKFVVLQGGLINRYNSAIASIIRG
ncbi:DUF6543 domain-containing protein [Pseudomonas sp. SR18]|uniref:dermonecrotic toxin domain-containing protein n=1 Tax=Pseudomonas sp. SR18 TaxID=1461074 RepID=UPI002033BE3B|nr:DUF6543 domain-containing protein [Pseudomonas sp. SR18]MCM2364536.1 hypothetical protein [Pseudomonas sp. SR18]